MTRVLIVAGSAVARKMIRTLLASDPEIEVVGTAMNASIASRKIRLEQPDVLTLDVETQEFDGIGFLRDLMRTSPMPVVMMSNSTGCDAKVAFEAMELGAVDYVSKSVADAGSETVKNADEIIRKVKAAAQANVVGSNSIPSKPQAPKRIEVPSAIGREYMVIAIGASTGGTEAIKDVLSRLSGPIPGIVLCQHIPGTFSKAFAERLNQNTEISVCQAQDGQPILPGRAYLAPGDRHLRIERSGNGLLCRLDNGPQVNRHKPSVDVMFKSVAQSVGAKAVGVLLTGMGDDGSESLGLMRASGAVTIAQDEASSVVWGMPGEAVKRGHVDQVMPLQQIGAKIMRLVSKPD